MIRLVQCKLIIPRGDTGSFSIQPIAGISNGDVAVFTILDKLTHTKIFQKTVEVSGELVTFSFSHNETVNLEPGFYSWDIKFYKNPVYADGELINGDEVDSCYAGFSLPQCEIRPTGDKLQMSNTTPSATLRIEDLDIITAAINEVHTAALSAEQAKNLLENCSAEAISVASNQPAIATYADGVFHFEIPRGETIDISGKADKADTILTTTLSRGRKGNTTVGNASFAFGENVEASGYYAHAEGSATSATSQSTHAEGSTTTASNFAAHAEGSASTASGTAAHAEGYATTASGNVSHAEGDSTVAQGNNSHAEGWSTIANGVKAHAEGDRTTANGTSSHAEGSLTVADAINSHAEGVGSRATGHTSHAEGSYSVASGPVAHAEGQETFSAENASHSEGLRTYASGTGSHTEGISTAATGAQAHAEGLGGTIIVALTGDGPQYTVTGNVLSPTYINCPIVDRDNKIICKILSINNNIITLDSNAFGTLNEKYVFINTVGVAIGRASHVEGLANLAVGHYSHAEGGSTIASGSTSHTEGGLTTAAGDYSHAEGYSTVANHKSQHVFGEYNISDSSQTSSSNKGTYVEIVGNGTSYGRSNARALDWNGNEYLMGDLYVECQNSSSQGTRVAKITQIPTNVSQLANDSNYYIKPASGIPISDLANGIIPDLTGKADKTDTVLNTTLSIGRKNGTTVGNNSIAIGSNVTASGTRSQAFGSGTAASADNAHAEGSLSSASAANSHAEGASTEASGAGSHAEGLGTRATNEGSHAEGSGSQATMWGAHAEGLSTKALGEASHAEGSSTTATHYAQHVFGQLNALDPANTDGRNRGTYIEIVGNGNITLSNARTLDWNGNERLNGTLYVNCNDDSTGGTQVATINDIPSTSNKADKVSNATSGNFAALDASGNLIDSGHSHNDYLTAHQDISGKLDTTLKGAVNGLAELDANGKVPSSQLPSYVDDVLEYDSQSAFPSSGETGKIYVDKTTNITYRWSGTAYIEISASLALGETSATAYRGDYGAAAYAHAVTNKGIAKESGLYKITTNSEGHLTAATSVEKADITALGIPAQDTTYESKTAASGGNDASLVTTGEKYIWNNKYDKPTNGIPSTDLASGVIPDITGKADKVSSATEGNFASLDSNGNLVDSGHKHSDYLTAHQTIPVTDVKINNTTIVSNNVANIPIAGASTLGVVKVNGNGLSISSGQIQVNPASLNDTKAATKQLTPIVPAVEHGAAFYGLAKAAGDTTQSQSSNAIGTYTEEAKAAIRTMLGVASDSIIAVQDTQPINSTTKIWINDDSANTVTIPTYGEMTDALDDKADKVTSATNGNFAALDSNGNLIDSGHKHSDYLTDATTASFYGLASAANDTTQASSGFPVGIYTEEAQSKISDMLNIPTSVSGNTPSIIAKSGIRYICGEVSTLSFTPSSTGICDVRFSSGSSVTILTVPSTIKWPDWFDPTNLEANVTYELNIQDGIYGVVGIWR